MNKCVVCQKEASTTIYEIPVCQEHFQAYKADIYRVYDALEVAHTYRQRKEDLIANFEHCLQRLRYNFANDLKVLYNEYQEKHPDIFLEDGTITLPKSSPSQTN